MSPDKNQSQKDRRQATRPPIVVVLGHVDHGKTSILDKIRQTKVAEKEAGGITQHIGAYQAEHNGKKITFLDTPGHEAFSAIRSRGAKVADIAILVVAAEEGVKPQTKEAIQIIKTAKIPFVVAINKIDKEGANPARVRQELAEQEVQVEDYGGTVPVVELSTKKGEGINELLEMILLVSEMEELTTPMDSAAKGFVIESHLDGRRGITATLIIQEGELKTGDWISAGNAIGHVKSIEDFLGKTIGIAIASQPCVIMGWEVAPRVGQEFQVVAGRDAAQALSLSQTEAGPSLLFETETGSETEKTNKKIANLIIKADVQSSLEAIDQTLRTIHSEEVKYRVINYGVGTIGDNDVKNARASGASIIGFHVSVDGSAKQLAEREGITVKSFDIIYELVETARSILADLLDPEIRRTLLGKLKILAVFKNSAKSQIVGGKVTQGKITRGAVLDVIRNGATLITGKLGQLQHNKADIAEVSEGLEAGIRFDMQSQPLPQQLIKEGDTVEAYHEEKIKRTI
ncbi:MAG: translation initiation factor IF-2 [Candidatus Yanofskybacteria bacterium RIFCSPHIGHO2_01_FULL_44_17]|uniref:Translation initiation factor IF-2 n=1 Tax=Candidatus Yanofskybacteria bacterium RIFCSPHIGHO2_01_FULL_44_17 TaxID=1802668 RepID=A0A1F8EWZ3_9BACT|nr:MAG: translation initiation factor IF-2 [Candidatus Yanofskybacteria bacterium RIFCSPHIGHO2_01_FULL_44_17]